MTFLSIIKTVFHIYCSSILFGSISMKPVSPHTVKSPFNPSPVMMATHTDMAPTAPPKDRGSGR